MKNPMFSIIIPCYNSEKYIDTTLQSIKEQVFKNYEVLCINDGSTDNTIKRLKYWKRIFKNQMRVITIKHQGVSAARNIGLKNSRGIYAVFLDSDDMLNDGVLEQINKAYILTRPDCFIGRFDCIAEKGIKPIRCELTDIAEISGKNQEEVLDYLHELKFIMAVWRFVIRIDIIKNNKIFFNETIVHEDEEWITKVLLYCQSFDSINIPFVTYRKRKGSITTSPTIFNYISKLIVAQNLLKFSEDFEGYQNKHLLRKAYRLCKEIYYTLMEKAEGIDRDERKC